jgi:hypothetical protein
MSVAFVTVVIEHRGLRSPERGEALECYKVGRRESELSV